MRSRYGIEEKRAGYPQRRFLAKVNVHQSDDFFIDLIRLSHLLGK